MSSSNSLRVSRFLPVAVAAFLCATAPAVWAGTTSGCPSGSVATSTFASANLGSLAATCGSVTTGANSVTTSIPTGAPGFSVESWLAVTLSLPGFGFSGQNASVLQFSNFSATQGSTIDFNWTAAFDPGTEGYAFALLDGQLTVLATQFLFPAITTGGGSGIVALNSAQLNIASGGTHSASFGIVEGCTFCLEFSPAALDPSATFSNITLTDSTATPEPATLSLMGSGLAGVFAGAARRKRS